MKKTYINPSLEVVVLVTQPLLNPASLSQKEEHATVSGGSYNNSLSPYGYEEDEEDEEDW